MRRVLLTTLTALLAFCVFTMTLGHAMDQEWKPRAPAHSLTFKRAQLTALAQASSAAAWCGGYVIIDTNDQEVLVANCDK